MKNVWVLLAAVIIATGLWFLFKPKNPAVSLLPTVGNGIATNTENVSTVPGLNHGAPVVSEATPATITQAVSPLVTAPGTSPAPPAVAMSSLPPLTVLDNARVVMHNYAGVYGENPVGDNSEITAALMGKNPKQVNFISEESGLRVNDKGELIDAWGTPFFFHQLSGKVMEIRSAGEDRKMWTFDDQVTR
ncbi:MAG TPA: hypothetical protein VG347_07425 [Verrucomicrobiae bacterium]|nr:hypothetical protein [Verrucomicrobiae bacterium]